MPRGDGTGPMGQGPMTGRGFGRGFQASGFGRGSPEICRCPKCGNTQLHMRGQPCAHTKCEKCGTPMVRGDL